MHACMEGGRVWKSTKQQGKWKLMDAEKTKTGFLGNYEIKYVGMLGQCSVLKWLQIIYSLTTVWTPSCVPLWN